jgi:hypothetical protein
MEHGYLFGLEDDLLGFGVAAKTDFAHAESIHAGMKPSHEAFSEILS